MALIWGQWWHRLRSNDAQSIQYNHDNGHEKPNYSGSSLHTQCLTVTGTQLQSRTQWAAFQTSQRSEHRHGCLTCRILHAWKSTRHTTISRTRSCWQTACVWRLVTNLQSCEGAPWPGSNIGRSKRLTDVEVLSASLIFASEAGDPTRLHCEGWVARERGHGLRPVYEPVRTLRPKYLHGGVPL